MNLRYYNIFKGLDDASNRIEILTNYNVQVREVKTTVPAFTLAYQRCEKLTPVRGAQATIKLISETNFQFTDLHTDDMQGYMVKFFREDKPHWIGWLDSEYYEEKLSDYPPYPVEFSASDFNIWERLKYRDASDKMYVDIVPFVIHLKRCFDKLNLPFHKLYIGSTTVPNDVPMSATETPLHVLYMMSQNFYDEDKEPMTCREVVEAILQPFGLMMVQKDANVYIYDYNTLMQGLPMKRYDFDTFSYEADEVVNFDFGNLVEIGFASTDGEYGFEEMVNNVTITSSLYANALQLDAKVDEESVTDSFKPNVAQLSAGYYKSSDQIENLQSDGEGFFVIFYDRNLSSYIGDTDSIAGCFVDYTPDASIITPRFRVQYPNYVTKVEQPEGRRKSPFYVNLKIDAYPSTADHPILQEKKDGVNNSGVLKAFCNLYFVDETGKAIAYYNNTNEGEHIWETASNGTIQQGKCVLWFSTDDTDNSILDTWTTNANKVRPMDKPTTNKTGLDSSLVGRGIFIRPNLSGYLVFEITNKNLILNPVSEKLVDVSKVKMILYNNINIVIVDSEGHEPSTDDYEFKSYVNKRVASDFDDVTLKCISANEEKAPIGKANILRKVEGGFDFQTAFTRAGQTDILERLLMCTIHSNFATKNEKLTVDVKMTNNPALSYVSCNPILSNKYLVIGCTLDYNNAKTTISAVDYSDDVAKLSNIPYDD